jgi:aminoglycoside phosphotransferase (APT) family kinase protein
MRKTIITKLKTFIKRPKRLKFDEGLPTGIDFEILNELCVQHLAAPLQSASYAHLSGWKDAGAFRLLLQTAKGRRWSVIYKNAVYNLEHIPALVGLPNKPGPPEYLIYKNARGPLAQYLPTIYMCQEVVPGKHYQYLLEDVGQAYQKVSGQENLLKAAKALVAIHKAMADCLCDVDQAIFFRYNSDFSTQLQEYVVANLQRYANITTSNAASEVLALWPHISKRHRCHPAYSLQTVSLIHGDFNPANILVHQRRPDRIKLIDWEWAGFGMPHADMASLLKRAPPEVEQQALLLFSDQNRRLSPSQHKTLYEWCQLERGLIDASFMIAQGMMQSSAEKSSRFYRYTERSLERVLRAYNELV